MIYRKAESRFIMRTQLLIGLLSGAFLWWAIGGWALIPIGGLVALSSILTIREMMLIEGYTSPPSCPKCKLSMIEDSEGVVGGGWICAHNHLLVILPVTGLEDET